MDRTGGHSRQAAAATYRRRTDLRHRQAAALQNTHRTRHCRTAPQRSGLRQNTHGCTELDCKTSYNNATNNKTTKTEATFNYSSSPVPNTHPLILRRIRLLELLNTCALIPETAWVMISVCLQVPIDMLAPLTLRVLVAQTHLLLASDGNTVQKLLNIR